MKIVVHYYYSDHDGQPHSDIACFEYKNCETFLKDFEETLKIAIQKYRKLDKELNKWHKKYKSFKNNWDERWE